VVPAKLNKNNLKKEKKNMSEYYHGKAHSIIL